MFGSWLCVDDSHLCHQRYDLLTLKLFELFADQHLTGLGVSGSVGSWTNEPIFLNVGEKLRNRLLRLPEPGFSGDS